jgi:hypothetical protein
VCCVARLHGSLRPLGGRGAKRKPRKLPALPGTAEPIAQFVRLMLSDLPLFVRWLGVAVVVSYAALAVIIAMTFLG